MPIRNAMPVRVSRASASLAMLAFAAALAGCALAPSATYEAPKQPAFYRSLVPVGAEVDGTVAAEMISGYRRNNGLNAVVIDPELTRLAKEHARAMAARNALGHDVGDGPLDTRADRGRYAFRGIAENVAGGYHTLAEAFSGWRDSPEHRKNMLMGGVTRMGIAVAQAPSSKYKVFWAMIVAEPLGRVAQLPDGPGGPPRAERR
jgi:uncharacterized protein YkwD